METLSREMTCKSLPSRPSLPPPVNDTLFVQNCVYYSFVQNGVFAKIPLFVYNRTIVFRLVFAIVSTPRRCFWEPSTAFHRHLSTTIIRMLLRVVPRWELLLKGGGAMHSPSFLYPLHWWLLLAPAKAPSRVLASWLLRYWKGVQEHAT